MSATPLKQRAESQSLEIFILRASHAGHFHQKSVILNECMLQGQSYVPIPPRTDVKEAHRERLFYRGQERRQNVLRCIDLLMVDVSFILRLNMQLPTLILRPG